MSECYCLDGLQPRSGYKKPRAQTFTGFRGKPVERFALCPVELNK